MKISRTLPLDLRSLLIGFALLASLATLCNCLVVAYSVQRNALINSTLEANHAYAAKVASSIGEFLRSAQEHLRFGAQIVSRDFGDPELLREEVVRLRATGTDFNSILITDATGKVLQAYPDELNLKGNLLDSEGVQQALKARRPMVSRAYTSSAGNLVVFISHPILSPSGQFLGVIGGSVYIRKESVLHTVISSHFLQDGTFVFVADDNRRLLYHPDHQRIGEMLSTSPTVDAALKGESAARAVNNYKGVPMLAGYAPVPGAHWAIVAQQPQALALATLGQLMKDMVIKLIPASLAGLAVLWLATLMITRPLRQLADEAAQLPQTETTERLQKINAWYSEVRAIRRALINSVQLLNHKFGQLSEQAHLDPLTGLANRRAMNAALDRLEHSGQPYSALALDIDHFKRVNDTFGHDAGDQALKQVAAVIEQHSRSGDLACRSGGEEFVLLLPGTPLESAANIAERIRESVAASEIPGVGFVTISIGGACSSAQEQTASVILKQADAQLYRAKESGRNRVCVAMQQA